MIKGKNIKEINILDNVERVVATKKGLNFLNEQNKVEFKLSPGIYIAQTLMTDGKIGNEKFVVQ